MIDWQRMICLYLKPWLLVMPSLLLKNPPNQLNVVFQKRNRWRLWKKNKDTDLYEPIVILNYIRYLSHYTGEHFSLISTQYLLPQPLRTTDE